MEQQEQIVEEASIQRQVNRTIHEALDLVSHNSQRYQCYLLVYLCALYFIMSFSTFSPSILFMNPEFRCRGQDKNVPQHRACAMLDNCHLVNDYTITSELKMYCGRRANDRNLIQSMFGMGGAVGVLTIHWLSSIQGKVLGFWISLIVNCMHSLTLLIGAYLGSTALIAISQFLSGAGHVALYMMGFLMLEKYGSKFARTRVCAIVGIFATGLNVGLFSLVFHEWQFFAYLMVIGYFLLLIPTYFLLKQDPIYLFNCNKLSQLKQILRSIAQTNQASKSSLDQALYQVDQLTSKLRVCAQTQTHRQSMWSLFTCQIVKMLVIMCLLQITCNIVMFGIGYEINRFQVDPIHVWIAIHIGSMTNSLAVTATIGCLLAVFTRKTTIIASAVIFAFYSCLFLTPLPTSTPLITLLAIFMLKFIAHTFYMYVALAYVVAFPKQIQNNCVSIVAAVGALGKVIAPILVRIASEHDFNPILMFAICVILLGVLPASLMDHID